MRKKFLAKVLVLTMAATLFTGINQVQDVKAADTTSGLVAHWKFDGDTSESVKQIAVAAESNITYEEGILGKAAVFNGKNSYLETSYNDALILGDNFTISFWAYNEDAECKSGSYLQMGRNCGWDYPGREAEYFSSPYTVSLIDGSNVSIRLSDYYVNENTSVNNEGSENLSSAHVDANEWFLFTVTYDGKTIRFFKDNVLLGQTNYAEGTCINPYGLLIGADEDFEEYFQGKIDDLKLYNRTLSYDDINGLYQEGLTKSIELLEPTKKLIANYTFDGNTADSTSFKNNGEKVEISGSIKFVQGKNGKAMQLSKGNYVEIPASDYFNFDKELTISYWLRVDKEGEYPVLCRQNPSIGNENPNDYAYRIDIEQYSKEIITSNLTTRLQSSDSWISSDTAYSTLRNEKNGTLGSWHHYTYTIEYDEENDQLVYKSYLNGKLNKKSTADTIEVSNASGSILIGFDNETFLTGAIDELQIYNYARSATQISQEYKRVDSISLSAANQKSIKTMAKGKSVKISSVTLKDADTKKSTSIKVSSKTLVLKSSNSKVVTIKNGTITAKKKGTANLTVSYGGVVKTYKITVK